MSDSEDDVRGRKELFVLEDGSRARFFLHPSINRESQRQNLSRDIQAYGGHVASTDKNVDTVLVSKMYNKDRLSIRYKADDDKRKRAIHVERLTFIQHCILENKFEHLPLIVKGMSGQLGRKNAVEFTDSDDEHLVRYIARMLPHEESGGRQGYRLYQDLVALGEDFPETFGWAKRHTFHAWRARYKKLKHRCDPEIERIAKSEGTYDEAHWPEDRRMSKKNLRRRGRRIIDDSEEDNDEEEEEEDQLQEDQEEGVQVVPQSEDEHGRDAVDYAQEVELPQAGGEEGPRVEEPVQDREFGPTGINKRKRVQRGASGRATKKRRNKSPLYPTAHKGKGIEHESDGDEEFDNIEDELLQVFENDGPGPSNVHSPDLTLAEPPSRSIRKQMSLTQETLVNSQAQIEFEPVSHSTSANRRHSGNTARSEPISRNVEEQESEEQPAPPSPQPAQSSGDAQQAPSNSTEPAHREPKPHSKQRSPSTTVRPKDAPYRNTRARSRIAQPITMPPPKINAPRRKQIPEEIVQETSRGPVETIEEMDVENMLMAKDSNKSVARPRDPSLETDDAQTRQDLRATSALSGRPSTFAARALGAIRKYAASSSTSRRYSPIPPIQYENAPLRRKELVFGVSQRPVLEPRTPMKVDRIRQGSTSSEDPFPLKGTRASAAKKKKQEQEKHIPFRPFEGTRAAQYARHG